jgi:hypothetical protein
MSTIFNEISQEVNKFNTDTAVVVDNFTFNQRNTIEKIIRLYNSKFKDGEIDKEGFRKYFKNIVRNPCNSAMKAIKFTPSDIMLLPAPGQSSLKAWLMDRDLKHWMKEKQFNKTLNRLFAELPVFGSVVLKLVKDEIYFVDLRNLINEQSSDTLKDAQYVIEQHWYSPHELRKQKWDNVEEVIEQWRNTKQPYIRILERYGEVPKEEFGGDPDKYTYSRFIVYIPESKLEDRLNVHKSGIVLDKAKLTPGEFPYREFHWEKIPGRWLGVGRVELLTDPQVRTNEIVNLRVKSSYVAGLNIWQTRDDTVKKNLIKEVQQGQVLRIMDRIERVPTEDRNTYSFTEEEQGWAGNRDEVAFTYDTFRGERSPAGTPLGSSQLSVQMMTSYFEHIREQIAATMKDLIINDIIPVFKKTGEHYLKLVGEDLEKWNELRAEQRANEDLLRYLKKNKRLPSATQYEAMKYAINQKQKKMEEDVLIPKDLYKDIKYDIDIVITGQDRDVRVEAANMAMALQTLVADPEVLTDPAKRKIFGKQLEAVGINIHDISQSEQEPLQRHIEQQRGGQPQKGGGVSGPSMPSTLMPNV